MIAPQRQSRALLLLLSCGILVTSIACSSLAPGARDEEPKEVAYLNGAPLPPMLTPGRGGDFALFYNDNDKPEVPVRVQAGEQVGFLRDDDGRLRAAAGAFQMNVPADIAKATWRRLNDRED